MFKIEEEGNLTIPDHAVGISPTLKFKVVNICTYNHWKSSLHAAYVNNETAAFFNH